MPAIADRLWRRRAASSLGIVCVLAFVVGVCLVGNIFWLTRHFLTIPPPWDQAFYLYMGVRYLWALSDHGLGALVREFIGLSPDVAPLFPLTSIPLYLLFGPSRLVAHLTNVFYLFLLLLGVYLLGVHIYGRKAGFLATFVMATFTATVNYSRDYLLEFPATALVTLALYAFLRAEEFRRRSWCLAFGALAGLSVLTKTMVGVFFIGPFLFTLGGLIRRRQFDSAIFLNSALAVSVGVLVASMWWGPNFRAAFGYLVYYGFQGGSEPYSKGVSAIFAGENLRYYALALINHGTSFLYAALFAVLLLSRGAKWLWGRWRNDDDLARQIIKEDNLWVWLLSGYVILTLVPNKGEERYAQPLLPPMALLLAGSIEVIGRQWLRQAFMVSATVIGGMNYWGLTYGLPLIPERIYVHPFAIVSHEYPHYSWVRDKLPQTADVEWKISAILALLNDLHDKHRAEVEAEFRRRLAAESGHDQASGADVGMMYRLLFKRDPSSRELQKYGDLVRRQDLSPEALFERLRASEEFRTQRGNVLVVPDHPQFNASTLRYYAEVQRVPLRFAHILDGPITAERLRVYEVILTKNGGYQGPEFSIRLSRRSRRCCGRKTPVSSASQKHLDSLTSRRLRFLKGVQSWTRREEERRGIIGRTTDAANFTARDEAMPRTRDTSTMQYSVVIPVYNEADVLPTLYARLTRVMKELGEPYEIIFVNDGSARSVGSSVTGSASQGAAHIRLLSLSRNFGHQIAISRRTRL